MERTKLKMKLGGLVALLLCAFALVLTPSITTYADTNGSGQDTNTGDHLGTGQYGGYGYAKSGWLLYVYSNRYSDNRVLGNKVFFIPYKLDTYLKYNEAGMNTFYLVPRMTRRPWELVTYYDECPWGPAWLEGGGSTGETVIQGFDNEDSGWWYDDVLDVLYGNGWMHNGPLRQEVLNDPSSWYIILEPVAFHSKQIYDNKFDAMRNSYIGTLQNWPNIHSKTGTVGMPTCDNQILARTAFLNKNWNEGSDIKRPLPDEVTDLQDYYTDEEIKALTTGEGMIAMRILELIPSIDTYWEPYGSPGDPEPAGEDKKGTFNIVKYYAVEKHDADGKLISTEIEDVYIEKDVCGYIHVTDEANVGEYKLVGWFTDTGEGEDRYSYEGFTTQLGGIEQHNSTAPRTPGLQCGRQEADVVMGDTEDTSYCKYQTLYVMHKRIEREEPTDDCDYKLTQSMITRTIWLNYPDHNKDRTFDEGDMAKHKFTWESEAHITQCSGHECTHIETIIETETITETETVWDPDTKKWIEVEVTKEVEVPKDVEVKATFYCSNRKWLDKSIALSIVNSYKTNYPDIVATKWEGIEVKEGEPTTEKRYVPDEGDNPFTRTTMDKDTVVSNNWDYVCVLLRGTDGLILSESANNGAWLEDANSSIDDLHDVTATSFGFGDYYTDSSRLANGKSTSIFKTYFVNDTSDGTDNSTKIQFATKSSCGKSPLHKPADFCKDDKTYKEKEGFPFGINPIVCIYTYSGSPDIIDSEGIGLLEKLEEQVGKKNYDLSNSVGGFSTAGTRSGVMTENHNIISFLPYVWMRYQTLDSGLAGYHDTLTNTELGWLDTYVMGQYYRSLEAYDYAEVSWNKQGSPNLSMYSAQWSTHALAAAVWGDERVLPGGATLSLGIKSDDRQTVWVTTYQVYTDGSGREQCLSTKGDPGPYKKKDLETSHDSLVESVAGALGATYVQQWQSDNVDDGTAWNNGQPVNRGGDLSGLDVSGKNNGASPDSKYYFDINGEEESNGGSSRGNFDVTVLKDSKSEHTYTFYATTDGNIWCVMDNVSPKAGEGSCLGPKGSALNGDAKAINDRTHVVDMLVLAVEQSVNGDDELLPNGEPKENLDECCYGGALSPELLTYGEIDNEIDNWYNEAFCGVTVLVQETKILTGFIDPSERTEVLDPRLTKVQNSKSGQFGMNEDTVEGMKSTYEMGQFRTMDYSMAFKSVKEADKRTHLIAYFKGQPLYMKDLEMLYWSDKFYIPNFTVQDIY